jgi:hypothetical protein
MITFASHQRWPLQPPSWIWFPSFSDQRLGRLVRFLVAHWGDWWKVPFDDQHRHSSKMAATAAILDLVSIDFLANAWVNLSDIWWLIGGDWRKVPFDDQRYRSSNPTWPLRQPSWIWFPSII